MANEVRLIDANAMLATIRPDDDEDTKSAVLLSDVKKLFRNAIANAPTIDPESLRPMGRVVLRERHRGGFCKVRGLDEYGVEHTVMVDTRSYGKEPYCSECGAALADSFQDYCPRCGVKMEG